MEFTSVLADFKGKEGYSFYFEILEEALKSEHSPFTFVAFSNNLIIDCLNSMEEKKAAEQLITSNSLIGLKSLIGNRAHKRILNVARFYFMRGIAQLRSGETHHGLYAKDIDLNIEYREEEPVVNGNALKRDAAFTQFKRYKALDGKTDISAAYFFESYTYSGEDKKLIR